MKILVSFCNQYGDQTKPNLEIIDTDTKKSQPIKVDIPNMGFHGVNQDDQYIYTVYRADNPGITILDRKSFDTVLIKPLPEMDDPHSIAVIGNHVYIVSTGTDQVLKYELTQDRKVIRFLEAVWSPEDSDGTKDTHHINSLSLYNDELYISGFGPKKGELWNTADEGYIYNVTKGEKVLTDIYHPHSLCVTGQGIYYCNSSQRQIHKDKDVIITLEKGYTRGLTVKEGIVIVGSSTGRRKSKSTGKVYNIADPGLLDKSCNIRMYEKKNDGYYLQKEFDFSDKRVEIFDVMVMD